MNFRHTRQTDSDAHGRFPERHLSHLALETCKHMRNHFVAKEKITDISYALVFDSVDNGQFSTQVCRQFPNDAKRS